VGAVGEFLRATGPWIAMGLIAAMVIARQATKPTASQEINDKD